MLFRQSPSSAVLNSFNGRREKHTTAGQLTDVCLVFLLTAAHTPHAVLEMSVYYYRAMHFSAKRGIAIACRLSVCLSVCNVGEL